MEYSRNSRSGHLLPGGDEGSVSVGSHFKHSASCVYRRGGGGGGGVNPDILVCWRGCVDIVGKGTTPHGCRSPAGGGVASNYSLWWFSLPFVTTVRLLSQVVRLAPSSYRYSSPLPTQKYPLLRRRAFDSMEAGPILVPIMKEMHSFWHTG